MMRFKKHLLTLILFFVYEMCCAMPVYENLFPPNNFGFGIHDTIFIGEIENQGLPINRPSPVLKLFRDKQKKNKRTIATLLAFPLPFGIVGLHRIYLGSAAYVPVAYIASLGGMFGVLPFVDFCVLMLDKNTERYTDNKKIFMWVN